MPERTCIDGTCQLLAARTLGRAHPVTSDQVPSTGVDHLYTLRHTAVQFKFLYCRGHRGTGTGRGRCQLVGSSCRKCPQIVTCQCAHCMSPQPHSHINRSLNVMGRCSTIVDSRVHLPRVAAASAERRASSADSLSMGGLPYRSACRTRGVKPEPLRR